MLTPSRERVMGPSTGTCARVRASPRPTGAHTQRELDTRAHVELLVESLQVRAHGRLGDTESMRDGEHAEALRSQERHVCFARAQAVLAAKTPRITLDVGGRSLHTHEHTGSLATALEATSDQALSGKQPG